MLIGELREFPELPLLIILEMIDYSVHDEREDNEKKEKVASFGGYEIKLEINMKERSIQDNEVSSKRLRH